MTSIFLGDKFIFNYNAVPLDKGMQRRDADAIYQSLHHMFLLVTEEIIKGIWSVFAGGKEEVMTKDSLCTAVT